MKTRLILLSLGAIAVCTACVKNKIVSTDREYWVGGYSSEFPSRNATREIEKIARSVKKIYSVSYYTTYQFKRESGMTAYRISQGSYQNAAWGVISASETVSGTATVIGNSNSRIALLSCAHIISSPDTIWSYFDQDDENPLRYVQSFSVKSRQENWIRELSSCGPFQVVASDLTNDIAILGKKCETLTDTVIPFPYPSGQAAQLGWGSFVYILGYPMGNQMITKGIVSPAAKRPMGEFSVDALLNKGYSGGIILALRNGIPNFELVGMVKTVNSTRENFLKPASEMQHNPDWMPYNGDAYIGRLEHLQYGMNVVVPFESIVEFYKKNRNQILSAGYNLDIFFRIK